MGPIRGDGSDKFFGMENVRLLPHSDFYPMRPMHWDCEADADMRL